MRKALLKGLQSTASANWNNSVGAEDLNNALGFLRPINNRDRIKAAAPHRVTELYCVAKGASIAGTDRPADAQRTVAYVDANSIHRNLRRWI